ncbi:CAAX amino terminal protease self- immunity [Posidoniimonas polymericola]|uniref:CAAX amino terminal protease self-immunity n=1 Tax=Posidoniimonas polymericola TaxID=2528002 RepID=A0A5C5YGZ6_9BACT|nr:CPBP family intramembrane glutamic endopeptidase [Posidoniimonas polymericola]TWT74438.1 CAAX amino terminal protease self- immunity [Posidoniimonas polymericola]
MAQNLENPAVLASALAAELGLAIAGAAICWGLGLPLAEDLSPRHGWAWSLAIGAATTAPMLTLLAVLERSRWRPLARLRRQTRRLISELLGRAGYGTIAAVSLAAGLGEEVLFRGALQPALATWLGPWPAVAVASVLFGLAHPLSRAYFVVATLLGLYLGVVTELTGELWPAIIAHAAYDFVALARLRRSGRAKNYSTS